MSNYDYISLIAKKLSNELNAAEMKALTVWLDAGEQNSGLQKELESSWDLAGNYKQDVDIDVDLAFDRFATRFDIPQDQDKPVQDVVDPQPNFAFKVAAAFVFIVVAGLLTFNIYKNYTNTLNNTTDKHKVFMLEDGSQVTLSPTTRIKKSGNFSSEIRDISEVKGQAFFEVVSKEKPFTIDLRNGGNVEVHRASFNVQNYENELISIVDVQSGAAVFRSLDGKVTISEGERGIFHSRDGRVEVEKLPPSANTVTWYKNILSFNNTPLPEVFSTLEKYFGVDIEVTDGSSMNCHFTVAQIKDVSLSECLELLHSSIPMYVVSYPEKSLVHVSHIQCK